jgi:hypothetical protein
MEKVSTLMPTEKKKLDNGPMERESDGLMVKTTKNSDFLSFNQILETKKKILETKLKK